MKRSNFTFLVSIALLLWLVPKDALAQCDPVTNITVTELCDGTVDINWTPGAGNQTYNVEIEQGGNPIGSVHSNVMPPLNVNGLNHGVNYDIAVTGVCDNGATLAAVAQLNHTVLFFGPIAAPTMTTSSVAPSCPGGADGTLTVALGQIGDAACAFSTYTVTVGALPAQVITTGSSYTWTGLSAGDGGAVTAVLFATPPGCFCIPGNPPAGNEVVPAGVFDANDITFNVVSQDGGGTVVANGVVVGSPVNVQAGPDCKMNYCFFSSAPAEYCPGIGPAQMYVFVNGSFIESRSYNPDISGTNFLAFCIELEPGNHTIRTDVNSDNDPNTFATASFVVSVAGPDGATVVAQSQNATIPKCEDDTEVCVSVTVVTPCGDVDPNGLVFTGALSGSGTFVGNNTFEFCANLGVTDGTYTATYNGQHSATGNIIVNQAADDEGPVIVAHDENIEISPCLPPGFPITYSFTIHDDCAPIDINEVIAGWNPDGLFTGLPFVVSSGNPYAVTFAVEAIGFFVPGQYFPTITYGGVTVEPLIQVIQFQYPPVNNIACNANINLSLDAACGAVINADMFTEGAIACNPGFTIKVAGYTLTGQEEYYVYLPVGQHQFEISYPTADAPCWGYINVERKIVPDPVYIYREIMCTESTKFSYDLGDVLDHLDDGCYSDVTDITYSDYDYGQLCDGDLTWVREWRGFVTIDGQKQYVLLLVEHVTEIPLTIDMINLPLGGSFDDPVKVWCPDGTSPEEVAAHFDLKCTSASTKNPNNEGVPYAYPYLIKGEVECVTEVCTTYIEETRVIEKILIDGKWVEVTVVYKEEITDCDDVVDTYPKYVPLEYGKTCNIDVKYQDMGFNSCTGPDTKIMRTWTLLDWCTGTIAEHVQWIKVVDETPPVINKGKGWPNQYVSIAPWTCVAEYEVNIPVTDNCSDYTTKIYTDIGQVKGNVITGLWKEEGAVRVHFSARDECGNESEIWFYIYIEDHIPPVMIAEDQINVTLTGDIHGDGDDLGIAKVYTHNIDAGSHDAGCGDVYTCVLLKEELGNPIYDPNAEYAHTQAEVDYVGDDEPGYGYPIYHAAQCAIDGTITFVVPDGKGTKKISYDYVVCKDIVKFCCADVGDNQVALVGVDHYGNYSHSWTTVTVEDKTTPIYYCQDDDWLFCGDDYDVYDYAPDVYNSLCAVSDLDYDVTEDIDACGEGYVEIVWSLDGEVICVTHLYYHGGSQFDPYNIRWPKHYDGEVVYGIRRECEERSDGTFELIEYDDYVYMGDQFECEGDVLQEPVWCDADCALVGSNYEDLEVDATDACRKIIRRWTVIDWCTWDPNGYYPPDDNNDGGEAFIAVDDEWLTADGLEWVYSNYYDKDGILRCEECVHNSGDSDDVYFRYQYANYDGYYTFDQVIKIIDETAPVIDAPEEFYVDITDGNQTKLNPDYSDCEGEDVVDATASDLCLEAELDPSNISWYIHTEDGDGNVIEGPKSVDGPDASMSTGTGEPGDTHYIYWNVQDGCGNIGTAVTEVHFRDVKNPTPICIQDISTATMNNEDGSVTIWAKDYDLGSFDNCSEVSVYFKDTADNYVPSLTFTCADIPNGVSTTVELAMWAVDASGNADYCFVTLRIDDNSDACADVDVGAADIGGVIANRTNDAVESARVSLSDGQETMTPVEGTYAFKDNTKLTTYTVSAEKNDDHLNGVSTLDAVLLQKHILGLVPFNDPYKAIAGDINNSGDITAADIINLRQLILGIYDEFPNNQSWRFVDASQTFADANNPFPFTEQLTVESLEGPMMDLNFVAVKIGDVSGNSIANSLQGEIRSSGTLTLEAEDRSVSQGEIVSVDVRGANFSEVSGYQFTMELSGLEFVGAESGAVEVSADNFGLIDAATVTTAWYNSQPVSTSDVLFTLKFEAQANVSLSEALSISSRVTNAVAYTGSDYSARNVEMIYGGDKVVTTASYELGQNEPNPFAETTTIGFTMPKAGQVTFSVFDVTGKLVVEKVGEYAKGANTITLTKDELGATSGVLYYQMKSGEFKASRKMILMN